VSDDAPDLAYVTTEQLIEELMNRHDGLAIAREVSPDVKGETSDCFFDFAGGVSRALGLCERLKHHLISGEYKNQRTDDLEEDDE
jgi:hypothetical protein